jgi:hypothetical protein
VAAPYNCVKADVDAVSAVGRDDQGRSALSSHFIRL